MPEELSEFEKTKWASVLTHRWRAGVSGAQAGHDLFMMLHAVELFSAPKIAAEATLLLEVLQKRQIMEGVRS